MALLTTQSVDRSGLQPAFGAAAAGGDSFAPGDLVFLHVKNGGASAMTVTIVTPKEAFEGAAIDDTAVSVPASDERMIGPFPRRHYADPTDGLADITYSAVTSVTIAVIELSVG